MLPRIMDPREQAEGAAGAAAVILSRSKGASTRNSSIVRGDKGAINREDLLGLPVAIEGVHWRREEAPAHSKSGSAVTRCLMLTDPSCITFSRRNYLEDHFRIVHQMFPSKPRVGRKKTSNKPSRCISPTARERMADHMQGDFPFKFWKAKKKRFVMSTTKAKHMWCSVNGHENASEAMRREWVWRKAADFYRNWRDGPLAFDTMLNLATHVEEYWNGKGIVDAEDVAIKGRIPAKYEEFVSDEEAPVWETNKDGKDVCRRRLKSKAIEEKPSSEGASGNVCLAIQSDGRGIAESASDDDKEGSASTVEELPSSLIDISSNMGHRQGMMSHGAFTTHDHLHRAVSQDCSMQGSTSGPSAALHSVHGSFTSLLNVITPGGSPEHHLMAISHSALDGAHHPLLHDHRNYDHQQQAARV